MSTNTLKDWTVLIYANGNNEMEPEIYDSFIKCIDFNSNENINVLFQIGRVSRNLVKILRPKNDFSEKYDSWIGVRRYYIEPLNAELITDLGKTNMADPKTLYDFIKWGVTNYEAKHYMLILSGHGASYGGGLLDLSYASPYIMEIPSMAMALSLIKEDLNIDIDILVLDMCYMNSIEILYEFGKDKNSSVKNLITYINKGPLKGLPYNELISYVNKKPFTNNPSIFIKDLLSTLDQNLLGFKLDIEVLKKTKENFNDYALCHLSGKEAINPIELLNTLSRNYNTGTFFNTYVSSIGNNLKSLFIGTSKSSYEDILNLLFWIDNIDKGLNYYKKFSFAMNNYWVCLLSELIPNNFILPMTSVSLAPTLLSKSLMYNFICQFNPTLTKEELLLVRENFEEYSKENYE